MPLDEAGRAAERVARESYGRLIAYLTARTRDVAGAEDALSEAFAAALRTWPVDGVPKEPDAWLLTAARRRQTDELRRGQTRRASETHLQLIADELATLAVVPDRRISLMFACAHPAIDREARTPLILQTILGLTADDIASAFLIPAKTMGQRLVRAKARIRDAGIPLRVPEQEELAERVAAVLDAIYAAYTRGWEEASSDLAEEAIWLGRLVVSLLPDEPEAKGMLALMFYTSARQSARRDASGAYVPLDRQDTTLWDMPQLAAAERLLREASSAGPSGRYQLEAAIQSAHVARKLSGADNWQAIVMLYDHLLALTDSPVVILNRAVARAELDGASAALVDIEPLAADPRMRSYQPYWAVKGQLSARAGQTTAAAEALTVAIGLSTDEAIKQFLRHQLAAL